MRSSFSTELSPRENYFEDDAIAKKPAPLTYFGNNFMREEVRIPATIGEAINTQLSDKPQGEGAKSILDTIDTQMSDPNLSWTNYIAGNAGQFLGFALNPFNIVGGAVTGAIARPLVNGLADVGARMIPNAISSFMRTPIKQAFSSPLSRFIPEMVGKAGEEQPLSLALLTKKGLEHFATGAGVGIPDAVAENYEADSNHINWGGVGRDMSYMGGFGVGFSAIFGAAGIIKSKINRGRNVAVETPVSPADVNNAVNSGHISPQEGQFASDMQANKNNPRDTESTSNLQSRASQIASDNGATANTATNEIPFNFLNPAQLENLQGTVMDRLAATDVPEADRDGVTNFIIHDALDGHRVNKVQLDAARGYVEAIDEKLAAKDTKLAEIDAIIDKHMGKGLTDGIALSQKDIVKSIKRNNLNKEQIKTLPHVVPDNVLEHLNNPEKNPLLHPKEELNHLREKLVGKNGLPKNWQTSKEYHRLKDLAEIWKNARGLLYRVDLEAQYERQKAYRDITKQIIDLADSDVQQFAQPEKAQNYVRQRVITNEEKNRNVPELRGDIEKAKVPTNADEILQKQSEQIAKSGSTENKSQFTKSFEKFKEFKSGEKIFSNLISCVMGALGNG